MDVKAGRRTSIAMRRRQRASWKEGLAGGWKNDGGRRVGGREDERTVSQEGQAGM